MCPASAASASTSASVKVLNEHALASVVNFPTSSKSISKLALADGCSLLYALCLCH